MEDILLTIIIPVYNQEELIVKALDSIPKRKDIEIIVIDDHSTDYSWQNIIGWKHSNGSSFGNITIDRNKENRGVGYTTNRGYELASGKWITGIDNDDYLLTDKYNTFIDNLSRYEDYDMVYLNNEINNGDIWVGTERSAIWSYAIKKSFLKDLRMPDDKKVLADWVLYKEILKLDPKMISSNITCYHYNYPREGSVVWNFSRGLLDSNGNIKRK